MTPEAAVYLQAVAGVSSTRSAGEHSAHMARFDRFADAARALRQLLPEGEVAEQLARLAAKLGVAQ